ncbi:hypothetical protein HK405_010146 [Cladochytrium tenue]|nr:hypothetical protein HK405_010146 [Cladochytrium tenue]
MSNGSGDTIVISSTATVAGEQRSIEARVRPRGATLSHLLVDGVVDVVQGFDTLEEQLRVEKAQNPYYSTIGRVCNRIANGKFTLPYSASGEPREFQIPINNGPNALHGGPEGFDKRDWSVVERSASSVTLRLESPDGDQGFPWGVVATVRYVAEGGVRLRIEYGVELAEASPAHAVTVANLTTHSYFNLGGFRRADGDGAAAHSLVMDPATVEGYLELSDAQVPTWRVVATPAELAGKQAMSFTGGVPVDLGARLVAGGATALAAAGFNEDAGEVFRFRGYDHFYLLRRASGGPRSVVPAATLTHRASGLAMRVSTDAAGFQMYTANWLDGSLSAKASTQGGAAGVTYGAYSAVCVEASAPPDAVNSTNPEWRDQVLVRKDKPWSQVTEFEFVRPKAD